MAYGELNNATVDDKYPLPNINQLVDELVGYEYYSVFDGFSRYWSIWMEGESIPLNAFLTPKGAAAWIVIPFGVKNAPPAYMRVVDQAMQGLEQTGTFVDDTAKGLRSQQAIWGDVKAVLDQTRAAKLKLKPCKYKVGYKSVSFVGHTLSNNGISMQHDKVQ